MTSPRAYAKIALSRPKDVIFLDLCNINDIKFLLAKHGFRFSKAKGQNFLTAAWVPQDIADGSGAGAGCGVLEIGPGFGCLTEQLASRADRVVAIEVDESLRPVLAETVGRFDNLEIIFGDALKTDLAALVRERFAGLRPLACANLPYYITSPILAALLQARCFESVTVMVQKEVADRICARAGTHDYSAFSVLCQYYAEPELLFDVPPSCFIPQPKVTSSVVRLRCRDGRPCGVEGEALYLRTVRAAFALRRKTLVNSLATGFSTLSKAELTAAVEQSGLSPTARGETLTLADFARLSGQLALALKEAQPDVP